MDPLTLGPNEVRSIIVHWNPFNKRDFSTTHMHGLYPNLLQLLMTARVEEYFIPFPNYMDKKSYQRVVKDEMFIRNHDFDKTTKLV